MKTKTTSPIRVWVCLLALVCLPVLLVQGQTFEPLWNIGLDDSNIDDFHQEDGHASAAPGSPTALDDDYFFAGQYPDPIGYLATGEPWANFERALGSYDPTIRIHFNLSERQALGGNNLRFTTKYMWYGGGTSDPVPFTVKWNDVVVTNGQTDTDPIYVTNTFSTASVNAVAGENIVTLDRALTGWAWICIDFVKAEVAFDDPNASLITSFTANPTHVTPHDKVTLSWQTDPGASLSIDQGVGTVTSDPVTGLGSIDIFPDLTPHDGLIYTLTATKGADTLHASVRVTATLINSFTATPNSVRIDDPVTLSWNTTPDASLFIEPGVGVVDGLTVNGVGSIEVWPASTTTYNLVALRGTDSEVASVDVNVNPRKLLWQLGYDDWSDTDFHQEDGVVNDPPGSPTAVDDDFYFAGTYQDPIGVVAVDEAWSDFERALKPANYLTRIHFNLTRGQAAAANMLHLTFKMYGYNNDPTYPLGDVPITAKWNDTQVLSDTLIDNDPNHAGWQLEEASSLAGDVGAVEGANVVTIQRATSGNEWVQFDYLMAEVEILDPTASLIGFFHASPTQVHPGEKVTLSWKTDPHADGASIDQGVGAVSSDPVTGLGSIDVYPTADTTYTLTVNRGAATLSQPVHVKVVMVDSFTATRTTIKRGESITLNWQVDPNATVSLAPTFGAMDAYTTAGLGSFTLTPGANATYTLTVTKPGFTAQTTVTVVVDAFVPLWEVGYEDNSQAEFSQEDGSVNDPPGSPAALDDDYYFAGTYAAFGTIPQEVTTTNTFGFFERALTSGNYLTRIHFNLNDAEAGPDSIFRVTFRLFGFNNDACCAQGPVSWVTTKWNDVLVSSNANVTDPTTIVASFGGADVGAMPGENIVTIERSLDGNAWAQFDYIKAEFYSPSWRVWQLGYNDNSTGDFHQEGGGVNPLPGSPTALDNDYYYAGTYPALNPPLVMTNEPWGNFERALTVWGDDLTRIHYYLSPAEAAPENTFYITYKLFGFNYDACCPQGGVPWVQTKWNDTVVASTDVETDPTTINVSFVAGNAGVVPGENTLTIQRSPDGNAWVQFDYIWTIANTTNAGGLRIAHSGRDAFGQTIVWNSIPGREYRVETSATLGPSWDPLVEHYPTGGATDVLTSFTDTAATGSESSRFYRIVDYTRPPVFSDDFETDLGWEFIDVSFTNTRWDRGTPLKGPNAAHSPVNAWCTGLIDNVDPGTEIILRSPVIDLTGISSAVLEFWDYRDMGVVPAGQPLPASGVVEIVDADGNGLGIPIVFQKGGTTGGQWQKERVVLPGAAMNRTIKLQFHFGCNLEAQGAGWFIDDVVVQPK